MMLLVHKKIIGGHFGRMGNFGMGGGVRFVFSLGPPKSCSSNWREIGKAERGLMRNYIYIYIYIILC